MTKSFTDDPDPPSSFRAPGDGSTGVEAAKPEALIAEAQVACFHDREFPVSSSDTALVLIDMQTDFLSKDGRLGKNYSDPRVKQLAATEAKVAALLAAARRAGMTVAHSRSHRYGADVRRDLCVPTIDPTYDLVELPPAPGRDRRRQVDLRRVREHRPGDAAAAKGSCAHPPGWHPHQRVHHGHGVQAVDRFFRVCLVEDCCGV